MKKKKRKRWKETRWPSKNTKMLKQMNVKWSKSFCCLYPSLALRNVPFSISLCLGFCFNSVLSLPSSFFLQYISDKKLTFIQHLFHNIVYLFKSFRHTHTHSFMICPRTHLWLFQVFFVRSFVPFDFNFTSIFKLRTAKFRDWSRFSLQIFFRCT